nr:MAG TPA: hypothetical protein [Caudoviricetes sp.]
MKNQLCRLNTFVLKRKNFFQEIYNTRLPDRSRIKKISPLPCE